MSILHGHPNATSFFGREQELEEISQLLLSSTCRLLTIIGPGGIGKTRIALEVLDRVKTQFVEGCYFVPLEVVEYVDSIIPSIAARLNFSFHGQTEATEQLIQYLNDQNLLIVLDGLEHLALEGALIITRLINSTSNVTILATSRERLQVSQEHLYVMPGLHCPKAHDIASPSAAAIRLFAYHGKRLNKNFRVDYDCVSQICKLVGGMPLGIELAAGWINVLSCGDIVDEIKQGLDILVADSRDLPERHRSMRAVIEYSWNLLSNLEQHTLMQMSVFRGTFDRFAAYAVCDASVSILSSLVEKSFLQSDGTGKFEVHELIRRFAHERLDEHPPLQVETNERHCHHYVSFLLARWKEIEIGNDHDAISKMQNQIENIIMAWRFASRNEVTQQNSDCIKMLGFFFHVGGLFGQGLNLMTETIERLQANKAGEVGNIVHAQALTQLGWFEGRLGNYEAALRRLEAARELFESSNSFQDERVLSLILMGNVLRTIGQIHQAEHILQEALNLSLRRKSHWEAYLSLLNLGLTAIKDHNYVTARERLNESLEYATDLGTPIGLGFIVPLQGVIAARLGESAAAISYFRRILVMDSIVPAHTIHILLTGVATLLASVRKYALAVELLYYVLLHPSVEPEAVELAQPLEDDLHVFITDEQRKEALHQAKAFIKTEPLNGLKPHISPEIAARLIQVIEEIERSSLLASHVDKDSILSEREKHVLRLVERHMSNREIADQLSITVGTVKRHLHNISTKLDTESRHHSVEEARDRGLLDW